MNIVLLGGNGYLGRNFSKVWLSQFPSAHLFVYSRSGKNSFKHPNITNFAVDVSKASQIMENLPAQIDYIVDFVGCPEKDAELFNEINDQPAEVMKEIAEKYQVKAMGFIGGKVGPKSFVEGKKRIISHLSTSTIPLVTVEPTIVYGEDRHDAMSKLIPLFKFMGIFSSKFKPITVTEVATELTMGLKQF